MKLFYLLFIFSIYNLLALEINVSYKGSSDYKLIKKSIKNTIFSIKQTNGDLQNLKTVFKSKNLDLAVVQSDILQDLVVENPQLQDKLNIISPLYKAAVVIITRKENDNIKNFSDLSNLPVAVDVEGSGDFYTFLKLQEETLSTPEVYNINKNNSFDYLDKGKVSAIFYIGNIDDISSKEKYNFISVKNNFNKTDFKIDANVSMKLSYVDKFLVTKKSKLNDISINNINSLISNIIKNSNKREICSFNLNTTPIYSIKNLYVVCSQSFTSTNDKIHKKEKTNKQFIPKSNNSNQTKNAKKTNFIKKNEKIVTNEKYFDNLEDIIIYPNALKKSGFSNEITSNLIETMKFDNAVKLIKDELNRNKNIRIIIESKGSSFDSVNNVDYIYRKLKKVGISRSVLIKKAININCTEKCFDKTTVQFKIL